MDANAILITLSFCIVVLTFIFGYLRWKFLDIVDLYIIMVGVNFGVYSFIDGVIGEGAQVFDDPLLVALVHLLVMIETGVAWALIRLLPKELWRVIKLKYLLTRWAQVPKSIIISFFAIIVLFKIYGYYKFGILSYFSTKELSLIGIELPYWFISLNMLFDYLMFCVYLFIIVMIFYTKSKLSWINLIAMLTLFGLYGRRSFFLSLFIFVVIWSIFRGVNLFSLKYVKVWVIIAVPFLVYSNIYQNYRLFLNPLMKAKGKVSFNIIDSIIDIDATTENLKERMAMWKINYIILEAQEERGKMIPYGEITWRMLLNTIPKAFAPEKSYRNIDEMIAELYDIDYRDYPSNIFASFQADFGYLSVFLVPFYLLTVILIFTFVITKIGEHHPTLLLFLSGLLMYNLLNVEADFTNAFILFRSSLIISFIYLGVLLLHKTLTLIPVYKKKS